MEAVPLVTLDLFVLYNNKILLGKRNNPPLQNIYYLFGGRVYKNEKLLEAAKRKASEELNLNLDINKLLFLGVYDDMFHNSIYEGTCSHYVPITYAYKLNKQEVDLIQIDNQHESIGWFSMDDGELHKMILQRVNDFKQLKSKNLY